MIFKGSLKGHPCLEPLIEGLWKSSFTRWDIEVTPVLPAREVVVAYLNEAGFSMFEPNDNGVVAHGEVSEVDVTEAQNCLDEVASYAQLTCVKWWHKRIGMPNGNLNILKPVIKDDAGDARCTIRAPFPPPTRVQDWMWSWHPK